MKKSQRKKKYREGGKNGGKKTLERHGTQHYSDIGKEGARRRWATVGVTPLDNADNGV